MHIVRTLCTTSRLFVIGVFALVAISVVLFNAPGSVAAQASPVSGGGIGAGQPQSQTTPNPGTPGAATRPAGTIAVATGTGGGVATSVATATLAATSAATATRVATTVATATRPATGGGVVATTRPATVVPVAMPRTGAGGTATSFVDEGTTGGTNLLLLAAGALVAGAMGAGALRLRRTRA